VLTGGKGEREVHVGGRWAGANETKTEN